MPQPESWCSDWRIIGFSASSSSCRSETRLSGYAAENAAHGGENRSLTASQLKDDRGGPMRTPSRMWWARPRKLCADGAAGRRRPQPPARTPRGGDRVPGAERGAAGDQHDDHAAQPRPTTRPPGSTGTTCRSRRAPRAPTRSTSCCGLLRRELRKRGAVAVHGNRHTDFVAALCAAHLHESRGVDARGRAAGRGRGGAGRHAGGGGAARRGLRGGPAALAHRRFHRVGPVGDHVGVHDRAVGVDRDREPRVGAPDLGDRGDRPARRPSAA